MAFTEKKYVDLAGLTTFRNSLKTKLSGNSSTDWAVNYAKTAGQATSDGSGNNIVNTYLTKASASSTYVPLTRTIAGVKLEADITADALRKAINVADGAQVNVIESVSIKGGATQTITGKNVELNLDAYAKKDDITAVLKFMGVVTGVDKLPTASADAVGHVYIVASGSDKDAYAEYVCVDSNGETAGGYAWEKLGNGASLEGYYTKKEIEALFTALSLTNPGAEGSFISTVSQTAGKVSASATAFATSVASGGKVAPTSGAVYTAIEGAKSALLGGETSATIKSNADAIAVLKGADTVDGSVAKKIKDAIGALDYTAGVGDYVTNVSQTDGKIAVTKGTKGEVEASNTGLVDGGTVHSFVTSHVATAIQGLDVASVGGDGKFLSAISEADGKISATVQILDTAIPANNPSTVVAPTTSAVKAYADSVYDAFGSVTEAEITNLFK